MNQLLTLGFFLNSFCISHAQIVNTISLDKTNMYFHALDSVVKLVEKTETVKRIIVRDLDRITNLPDSVNGKPIELSAEPPKAWAKRKIKEGEIIVGIRPVSIVRDQYKITILASRKNGRAGDGFYFFYYKYIPETQSFILRKLQKGSIY